MRNTRTLRLTGVRYARSRPTHIDCTLQSIEFTVKHLTDPVSCQYNDWMNYKQGAYRFPINLLTSTSLIVHIMSGHIGNRYLLHSPHSNVASTVHIPEPKLHKAHSNFPATIQSQDSSLVAASSSLPPMACKAIKQHKPQPPGSSRCRLAA